MIDRRPDDGQSQGDINPPVKGKHLERDMPLVVVHTNDRVEARPNLWDESGVRWKGSGYSHPLGPGAGDGRLDEIFFLPSTQGTSFSRVGVQAAHPDPRRSFSESLKPLAGKADGVHDEIRREPSWNISKSGVRGRHGHREHIGGEHHAHPVRPGQAGQHLSVAQERDLSENQSLFVDRSSDEAGKLSRDSLLDGDLNVFERSPSTACLDLTGTHPVRLDSLAVEDHRSLYVSQPHVPLLKRHRAFRDSEKTAFGDSMEDAKIPHYDRKATSEDRRFADNPKAQFGTDTGSISHRESQEGQLTYSNRLSSLLIHRSEPSSSGGCL